MTTWKGLLAILMFLIKRFNSVFLPLPSFFWSLVSRKKNSKQVQFWTGFMSDNSGPEYPLWIGLKYLVRGVAGNQVGQGDEGHPHKGGVLLSPVLLLLQTNTGCYFRPKSHLSKKKKEGIVLQFKLPSFFLKWGEYTFVLAQTCGGTKNVKCKGGGLMAGKQDIF